MTTDTTATTIAPPDYRRDLLRRLQLQLEHRGYGTVLSSTGWSASLTVSKGTDVLGEFDLRDVSKRLNDTFHGKARFDASIYTRKDGRFAVEPDGSLNITGVVRRLKEELIHVQRRRVEKAKSDARMKSDADIFTNVTGLPDDDALPLGIAVTVFDGKVHIKLRDLTPEQAKQVMEVVAPYVCVYTQDPEGVK